MHVIKSTILFCLVLIMSHCSEDEMAKVFTLDPESVGNDLVILRAETRITGVTEYGFQFGVFPTLSMNDALFRSKGPMIDNTFTHELRGMKLGSKYYVRAYVAVDQVVHTGEVKSFIFGGLTPEIIKIQPPTGHWFDTVKVVGKYFVTSPNTTSVTFGSLISKIVNYTGDSILYCVVPLGLPAGQSDVKVKVGDKISIASVTFTHEQPVVSSVNPLNATFLEQVTIEGSGFSARATNNKVMFGEFNADIVRATKTSLIVKVPTGINKSSTPIIVKVDSIQSTNTFSFQLKPAIVTSIAPATANLFETVTISGDNFNPIPSLNEVFFDNNQATVTHAEKSKLTLSVPNGIYMDREIEVSLTVGGITLLVGTVQLANPWIRKADIPSGMFGRWGATGFSIEGKGYAGIGGGNGVSSAYNDFYRFDETTNTWQRIADFGGGKRYWAASFVIGKIAYIGTGSVTDAGEGTRDFYKYDAENDSWTRISDFGGAASSRAIGFSINGKGYVCRSFGTNNFWEYDPAIDQWMKKVDFPAVSGDQTKRVTGAFVVNNQAYVLVTNYSQHELYLYNSSTDTWIKKNNLPHVTSGSYLPSVLSTTTHGYYFDGWTGLEYNPAQDQWRSVDFTPAIRNDSFFFSINNDIFLGGGREGNFKDFWKGETGEF